MINDKGYELIEECCDEYSWLIEGEETKTFEEAVLFEVLKKAPELNEFEDSITDEIGEYLSHQ